MFGRTDLCGHDKNGVCSKCVLRDTFNLSTESAGDTQNASNFQQNNTTTILSFDELLQMNESTAMPKFLPSSFPPQVCIFYFKFSAHFLSDLIIKRNLIYIILVDAETCNVFF
jgi:hypothetical protein